MTEPDYPIDDPNKADRLQETSTTTIAERFLEGYAMTHGGLERLYIAYEAAKRGEWASSDEVQSVFGD